MRDGVIDRGIFMQVDYQLLGSFNRYPGELNFDGEDTINLFLIHDPEGKKKVALLNTPGLKLEQNLAVGSNDPTRALFVFEDNMFGVFGSVVYKFGKDLVPVLLGQIGTNTGYVSITDNNGNQIIFVDGQSGYIYDITAGTFSQITSTDFPPSPINVAYLDTYFAIPSANAQTFQLSANNDGTQWNAFVDEAQIQTYPGVNKGVGVVNERLYFFKDTSTEIWYDAGDADFPFRKDTNSNFNYGCLAPGSIVSEYGYLCWLAHDKSGPSSVMMSIGYQPQKISTKAIESTIATFTNPADVSCYIYKESGRIFYVMNWTVDDYTLVVDIELAMQNPQDAWHRMQMVEKPQVAGDPNSGKTRHLGNCHAYFNNVHYVGSYKGPILYSFSRAYADNDGEPIRRIRIGSPFFEPGYSMVQVNSFQVDLMPGIGNPTGIYSDPAIFLSVSRDDGHLFGNKQRGRIGKAGQRKTRAIWRKKGLGRSFTPMIEINASVAPIVLMGAAMDYEVLKK